MEIDRVIKCVVWDLDNTLWPGVAAEGEPGELPQPDPKIVGIMAELERRGILNSLASRNDPSLLRDVMSMPELAGNLVVPQISWEPKSKSLAHIATSLNIGLESIAFVDDSPFERAEVEHLASGVLVLAPEDLEAALNTPPFNPSHLTAEAVQRADMYKAEELRRGAEASFQGSRADFLKWCQMTLTISIAARADLPRIAEMTERTHQLNSTGRRYKRKELEKIIADASWLVPVARLVDRFGDYGLIGTSLVNRRSAGVEGAWLLDLLMLSCRVEGRGIPAALLRWIMGEAAGAGAHTLRAVYRVNERNLPVRLLFRQMGFAAVGQAGEDGLVTVERSLEGELPPYPEWLRLETSTVRAGGLNRREGARSAGSGA